MEHVVAMAEGEWNNFSGMYSSTKEADFMAQLLGNCSLPNELSNGSNLAWHVPSNVNMVGMDETSMYSSDDNATNVYYFSQGSSYSGGSSILFPSSSHEGFYPSEPHQVFLKNNPSMSIDYCMVDAKNTNNLMEGDDFLNEDMSNDSMESNDNLPETGLHHRANLQFGRQHEMNVPESSAEEKMISPSDIAKKRSRIPSDVQKNKRNVKAKKNQRLNASSGNDDEEKDAVLQRQNSMSCCSEDDSNGSQELNGGAASTSCSKGAGNGKTRASRGSATDPQSLYARKRRERINERLRILQNLVPNGTKVDISTMLEEAVQYVKFLQLQIKLLSSDDLWMYAPIAYNGMDMGLDLKIATHKSS